MLLKDRLKYLLAFILIPIICSCLSCREDKGFPKEVLMLGLTDSNNPVSIIFPGSASGSISLTMECEKYSRGTISLSGTSKEDSSVVVFNYPFRIIGQSYPRKIISGQSHQIRLDWKMSNTSLKVFLDTELQTIRLAENGEPFTINRITIRNTSVRSDSSEFSIRFTGSCIPGDELSGKRVRIVAFGSSTTAYRHTISGVYSQRLPEKLSDAGIDNLVFNEGIGGSHTGRLRDNSRHNIPHALDRFDTSVVSRDPDVVIISLGLNDSWVDVGAEKSRIPKQNYRANLQYMIRTLRERDVKVILMTPNAIASQYEDWRYKRSSEYAGIARNIAMEEDIPLIDQWRLFEEYASVEGQEIEDLLLDGMHPNDQWHEDLSAMLKDIIIEQIIINRDE
jgi:lysophospholipase L1-like esterase